MKMPFKAKAKIEFEFEYDTDADDMGAAQLDALRFLYKHFWDFDNDIEVVDTIRKKFDIHSVR